jgi:hypothetical protein
MKNRSKRMKSKAKRVFEKIAILDSADEKYDF